MSEPPAPGGPAPVVPHAARGHWLWVGALLLLVLAAVLCSVWLLAELRRASGRTSALETEVQRMEGRLDSAAVQTGDLRARYRDLEDRDAGLDRRLTEVHAGLERMAQSQSNVDFALAEIEYLLILAEQRLTLMRDVETARAAMAAADLRLQGLQAPGLDAVRGQIAADLLRLERAPQPDLDRWLEDLGRLAATVEQLPLRRHESPQESQTAMPAEGPDVGQVGGWRGFLRAVWQELRSMVVVTRNTAELAPLPGQRDFLVQNLLLQVETARLALLRRDGRALHDTALSAARWLERWFDGGDPRVRGAREQLEQLASLDPAPPLPDISSSMETLRALIHERAAPVPVAPAPRPAP